jgi:hypothetical protein
MGHMPHFYFRRTRQALVSAMTRRDRYVQLRQKAVEFSLLDETERGLHLTILKTAPAVSELRATWMGGHQRVDLRQPAMRIAR